MVTPRRQDYAPRFTDEETEAPRGKLLIRGHQASM